MWSCAVRRGGRIGLSNLGSGATAGSWRGLAAGATPLGEGGLEFQTKRYPSFWNRLKQQKEGLGNMALSASIAFLAISIIKQEKELTRANESAGRLKRQLEQQQELTKETLDGLRSVLLQSEAGEKTQSDVLAHLRDVLDLNGEGHVDSPVETEKPVQYSPRSKFMV